MRTPHLRLTVSLVGLCFCGQAALAAQSTRAERSRTSLSDDPGKAPDATQPATPSVAVGESTRLSFYGLLRLDAIIDDSHPNALQTPMFILSEGTPRVRDKGASFTLHPRLSRLGTDMIGPRLTALGNPALTGKLELDFQNGGRESRALPRFRHAYLKVQWTTLELLAGQTWDTISPLFPSVNADTLMWNAGNLGDRRPQLRLTYEPRKATTNRTQIHMAVAAGLTGAVDGQDLDADGVLDGEESGVPNVQARIALGTPAVNGVRKITVGVSGHAGRLSGTQPANQPAGRTWTSSSLGIDYQWLLTSRVTLRGEMWMGENLSDFRGGIGQSLHPDTGESIGSRGGWSELGIQLTPSYLLAGGYSIDDPEAGAPRAQNRAWYIVNQYRLGRALTVGLDYLDWQTQYSQLAPGHDHRFNAYLVFGF